MSFSSLSFAFGLSFALSLVSPPAELEDEFQGAGTPSPYFSFSPEALTRGGGGYSFVVRLSTDVFKRVRMVINISEHHAYW